MLVKINNQAFDFFYTLKQDQKKHVNIVYDIRLKGLNGDYILVNHHLAPLKMTGDGKIAQGYTETQVAEQSKVSVNTIKFHKKNLFKKLGMASITSALQWFNIYKKL